MKNPARDRILLVAFLILLVAFGTLAARKIFISRTPPEVEIAATQHETQRPVREIILYFGSPQGDRLVAESREIACLEEIECVGETVRALVDGPLNSLAPVIPNHTVVREVGVEHGTAIVSFSRDLVSDHPGGSLSELLTVYGLANTVAVNYPHIRQVKILIEGEVRDTLKGHVGVREPVQADFRYSRSPEDSGE
jgi:spore germination protein GerM